MGYNICIIKIAGIAVNKEFFGWNALNTQFAFFLLAAEFYAVKGHFHFHAHFVYLNCHFHAVFQHGHFVIVNEVGVFVI